MCDKNEKVYEKVITDISTKVFDRSKSTQTDGDGDGDKTVVDYTIRQNRLLSFRIKRWPHPYIKTTDLVDSGFYFLGVNDRVQCAYCDIVLEEWEEADNDVFLEHLRLSPKCHFLRPCL